jgi:pimeloyl-ACP methyl ester carboxylesterase
MRLPLHVARPARPRDRFVTASGLRLRYRDWGGPGPVLLALHGAAAHAHWWDAVAPLLRGRLRVLALDWRGHGRSAWPRPASYRTADFAGDLRQIVERLTGASVDRMPVVAGHSMGGHVALAFAAWHPAHLAGLIVLDSRPRPSAKRLGLDRARPLRSPVLFPTLAAALERFRLRPPETIAPPALIRAVARHGVRRLGPGQWAYRFDPAYERAREPVDAEPLLPQITAPTLIVRGEHSAILPRDWAVAVSRAIPRAWLAEIPGAHHHVTLDAPPLVARTILRWLERRGLA